MRSIHLLAFAVLAPLANAQAPAANPSSEDLAAAVNNDLSTLNAHFNNVVRFKLDKRDRLVAEYLDNGSAYRTDLVYIEFLDASGCVFDGEQKVMTVRCQDERSKCIDKEVHKTGAISQIGRMELPLPANDPTGEKARQLLAKLVDDKQAEELTRLAETNTRERQKN